MFSRLGPTWQARLAIVSRCRIRIECSVIYIFSRLNLIFRCVTVTASSARFARRRLATPKPVSIACVTRGAGAMICCAGRRGGGTRRFAATDLITALPRHCPHHSDGLMIARPGRGRGATALGHSGRAGQAGQGGVEQGMALEPPIIFGLGCDVSRVQYFTLCVRVFV